MKRVLQVTFLLSAMVVATTASAELGAEGSMKDEMTKCDVNKDGMISKDEFMKSKADHFAKIDRDSNGLLDGSEQAAMISQMQAMVLKDTNQAMHQERSPIRERM